MSVADISRVEGRRGPTRHEWPQLAWWHAAAATASEPVLADGDGPYLRWSDLPRASVVSGEAPGRRAADVLVLVPSPGRDRAGRRRHERVVREAVCRRGLAALVGGPMLGSSLTVIQWPGADEHFVDLVVAVTREWDLQTIVVGTAGLPGRQFMPPDVNVAGGAVSLSRSIGQRLGRRPEWEVQHGKTHSTAAAFYIEHHRSGVIAIPHRSHGPRAHCDALDLALRADAPVLLA